ncbi:MAG: alpha/beta fold hydrolase [Pikeienuella sp.]
MKTTTNLNESRISRRKLITGTTALLASGGLAGCVSGQKQIEKSETAYPPSGKFMTVDGLKVHYVDQGSGPTVILIHGANSSLLDWTFTMMAKLTPNYRVIAFDRPGFGYSDRIAIDGANPETQAKLLSRAAYKLGVNQAVIVGHSLGGSLAASWALNDPAQVAGIAMLAGATFPWGGDGVWMYGLGANPNYSSLVSTFARSYVDDDRRKQFLTEVYFPNEPIPGYLEHIGIDLSLRPDNFRWNAEDIANLNDHLDRISTRYTQLNTRIEIIHGEQDPTVLASVHAVPLWYAAPDANLTLLPDVGHMVHQVEQHRIVAAIEQLTSHLRPV